MNEFQRFRSVAALFDAWTSRDWNAKGWTEMSDREALHELMVLAARLEQRNEMLVDMVAELERKVAA